jgi:anti-sigma factor RsiW
MEITRDVILDLLPLYIAGEVSADSRHLVEKYLQADPELARLAERTAAINFDDDIPIPLDKEDQMEAYKEAKRMMLWKTIVEGAVVAFSMLVCLGMVALVALILRAN